MRSDLVSWPHQEVQEVVRLVTDVPADMPARLGSGVAVMGRGADVRHAVVVPATAQDVAQMLLDLARRAGVRHPGWRGDAGRSRRAGDSRRAGGTGCPLARLGTGRSAARLRPGSARRRGGVGTGRVAEARVR